MRQNISIRLASTFILLTTVSAYGQIKPEEVAQRAFWEEFLQTAEIVKFEPIGEGVTAPLRLYLKKGDVEKTAAWKNPDGVFNGVTDSWKHEIAAYRLDKLLGLNMVPVYVERKFKRPDRRKEEPGSLSLWTDHRTNLLKMFKAGEDFPPASRDASERMKIAARLWDSLIANVDRTQQNILVTDDWRVILIDHSRAFQTDELYARQLLFGSKGIYKLPGERTMPFSSAPRELFEKVRLLDAATIKKTVGPYLTGKEIEGIVARIPLIMKELEKRP
jgi:hypothetical protein